MHQLVLPAVLRGAVADPRLGTSTVDGDEQLDGCSTSLISVTLYRTPGLHVNEGAIRAMIAAALDRPLPGVDAVRVAVEHRP